METNVFPVYQNASYVLALSPAINVLLDIFSTPSSNNATSTALMATTTQELLVSLVQVDVQAATPNSSALPATPDSTCTQDLAELPVLTEPTLKTDNASPVLKNVQPALA